MCKVGMMQNCGLQCFVYRFNSLWSLVLWYVLSQKPGHKYISETLFSDELTLFAHRITKIKSVAKIIANPYKTQTFFSYSFFEVVFIGEVYELRYFSTFPKIYITKETESKKTDKYFSLK